MNFKTCLILALFVCLSFAGYLPQSYKQNDLKWRSEIIGFGSKTIAEDGSLVTSLASLAAGLGIFSDGKLFNPSIMNEWLKKHGGFVQRDQVVWDSLTPLGVEFLGFTSDHQVMINAIVQGKPLIFQVKGENRYVVGFLITAGGFLCMDPDQSSFLDWNYYSFDEIANAGIYKVIEL